MVRFAGLVVVAGLLGGCSAAGLDREARASDVSCISRLYERPSRVAPFPVAVSACVGARPAVLTGARYYQVLASSYNLPFVSRDRPGSDVITLTGSRIPQSTREPAAPELGLN